MSPLALNVFDITLGLVLVSFAIWGFIITALTAWRGSASSRMPIKLLRSGKEQERWQRKSKY